MAQPPLEYQIEHADRILVCTTTPDGYEVQEALKGDSEPTIRPSTNTFELLGYTRVPGEPVVLIFSADALVNLLPVRDGGLVYAPEDPSIRREVSLDDLRALCGSSGGTIDLELLIDLWRNVKAERVAEDPDLKRFQKFMVLHEDMHPAFEQLEADPNALPVADRDRLLLHLSMDVGTESALQQGQPDGIRAVMERLLRGGLEDGEAFHVLSFAMAETFVAAAQGGQEFDPAAWLARAHEQAEQVLRERAP
jgi:hypothetical protein